jgi:hypothetical protein
MTHTIVIGEVEFEGARVAFVEAWQEQDRILAQLKIDGVPGTRTSAGLKAALAHLGIKVDA